MMVAPVCMITGNGSIEILSRLAGSGLPSGDDQSYKKKSSRIFILLMNLILGLISPQKPYSTSVGGSA